MVVGVVVVVVVGGVEMEVSKLELCEWRVC